MVHGSLAIPDRTDRDEVVFTREEIEATGLDYLALGHWHSAQQGKAGADDLGLLRRARAGRRTQDGAGKVLLVELDERQRRANGRRSRSGPSGGRGSRSSTSTPPRSPTSRRSSPRSRAKADPDLVLDARLTGVRPDELDLSTDEIEEQLKGSFLKLRVRDASLPALTQGSLPSPDTIPGAFIRNVEGRIAELEADAADAVARRGGRAARRPPARPPAARRPRGHPVRITPPDACATSAATASSRSRCRPGLTIVHGPNEAGKTTIQRAIELALTRKVTSGGADMDAPPLVGRGRTTPGPVISLEFEIEDEERGVRTGTLEKAFRGREGHGPPRGRRRRRSPTRRSPTRPLAELTGIPSEAFFRSTASVRHHELADLDRDEAALRDRLQASISGADRGHVAGAAHARAGDLRAEHEGRQEPGPAEGRRGGRRAGAARPSSRASSPSPSSSTIATRSSGARERRAETETEPRRAPLASSRRRARPSA